MVQDIERFLRDYLLSFGSVSAVIGARLYPNHAPQMGATFPYAVYHRVSVRRWRILEGTSGESSPRVQIDCYGETYAQASAARSAIAQVVDDFRRQGSLGSGSICLLDLRVEDERDWYETPVHGDEIGEHCCSIDLMVTYRG